MESESGTEGNMENKAEQGKKTYFLILLFFFQKHAIESRNYF